ncbi:hypothetical protein O6P43_010107 [Quillaja saponaria]|uniref:Uncharacterized protein n=1 Tax=Quillaja saponaria TaxID=32244 RepID=A0AAD7PZS3_QUISA|nr:hypothetical protein O6P43_010107 [Quillaja saponaria]
MIVYNNRRQHPFVAASSKRDQSGCSEKISMGSVSVPSMSSMATTKKRKRETNKIEEAKMIQAKVMKVAVDQSVLMSKRKRVLEKPKKAAIFSKIFVARDQSCCSEKISMGSVSVPSMHMSSMAMAMATTKKRKLETISIEEAKMIQARVAAESVLLSKRTRVLEKPKKAAIFSKKSVSRSTKVEAQVTINGTKRAVENPKAGVLPTIGIRVDEKKKLEKMGDEVAVVPKSKSTAEIISEWKKLTQEREGQRQREAARIEIEKIEREHEKKASVGEIEFQNLETMQQLEMLCGLSVSCQCRCLHYKGYTSVMDMGASEVVGHGIPLKNLGFYLKDE